MNADDARKLSEHAIRTAQEDSLRRHLEDKAKRLQAYKDKAQEVIRRLPTMLENDVPAAARSGKRELAIYQFGEDYLQFVGTQRVYKTVKRWFGTERVITGYHTHVFPDFAEAIAIECKRLGWTAIWESTTYGTGDYGKGRSIIGQQLVVRW